MARRDGEQKQESITGGYDCTVEEGVRDRYECSVCQLILRKPHLVSCCGAHFCEICIAKVRCQRNASCPLCRFVTFTTMLNLGLEREINQLTVYCCHKEVGCPWTGHVSELVSHARSTGGCGYVEVECKWKCGVQVRRKSLEIHETKTCPSRPWYIGIEDDNVRRLAETVECLTKEKTELWHHLGRLEVRVSTLESEKVALGQELHAAQSQIQEISGVKNWVEAVKRENARLHTEIERLKSLQSEAQSKSENLTALVQTVGQDLNSKIDTLSVQVSEVSQREAKSTSELELLHQEFSIFRQKEKLLDSDEAAAIDPSPVDQLLSESSASSVVSPSASDSCFQVPFDFAVDHCKQRRKNNADYYSLPFLSHEGGYKMCTRVCLNGMGSGKGTHVSVYIYMMRGENDDDLVWPFCGNIHVHLLNQIGEDGNHERVVDFSESSHPSVAGRVRVGDRAGRGHGYAQFISHFELKLESLRNRQFLKNDQLVFRIMAVGVLSVADSSVTKQQKSVLKRLFK